ncbi:MAG: isochorismatase family cysteine hydrolase [Aliishimia sp.]
MWVILAIAFLGAILWLANGIRLIGAVSQGAPIAERSEAALLMIDLQSVFWNAAMFSNTSMAEAEACILTELERAKANGIPIIAIRQEWSIPSTKVVAKLLMKGQAIEGTPGTEVAAPFDGLASYEIVKRVQDAFETSQLDTLLETLKVGKLSIVGLDTNYCIAKTALAARQRGYEVEIVKRAVLSADQKNAVQTLDMLAGKHVKLV